MRDMISWMARRSLSLCRGLLMPISRWISVSDRADMIAPLFTLARQAATYQAGIPTHSCNADRRKSIGCRKHSCLQILTSLYNFEGGVIHFGRTTHLQPHHHSGPIPLCKRQTLSSGFLQQLVPTITEMVISYNGCYNCITALTSLPYFFQ